MTSVQCLNAEPSATSSESTQQSRFAELFRRFEEVWNRMQVGRQGSYSVERLELLDHYCKTTSRTRVFLVCALTPLPVLTATILLECLPLRPPSEGWAANWMFWIRLSLMVFTLSVAGYSQMNTFIPGFNLSKAKMAVAALGICVAQSGTYLLEGAVFGFPVPFMWQLGAVTMAVYGPGATRIVFGSAPFTKGTLIWLHHERFQRAFFVHLALTGIYPLYKVLYDLIPHGYKGAVIVGLPAWRFAAKSFVVHFLRDIEDFIPECVAFSVDFFSALFLSVCMSTSGSVYLSCIFIATDVCQSLLEFREVRHNANELAKLLGDRLATAEHLRTQSSSKVGTADLLMVILGVARNPSSYHVTLEDIRLWACPPKRLPEKLDTRMQALGESGVYGSRGHPSNRKLLLSGKTCPRLCLTKVAAAPASTASGIKGKVKKNSYKSQGSSRELKRATRSKQIVVQGLQLLFHCEYLALVEYTECVVPLIFVAYKSVLEKLPNVVYYPGGAGHWGVGAVVNLLVFAALEIGSLLLLHLFFRRKFAFSPLYQLAFVLETQVYPVQANLFLETVFLLQYQLEHLGADFTFRFDWLRGKSE